MIFKHCIFSAFLFSASLFAKPLKIYVTLPDFIEVFEDIGGEHVDVKSFLNGSEDPHFVDVVPSFVLKASKADIVCGVGLELEVGWLPKVLQRSRNAKVQPGGSGYCELGQSVKVIEVHKGVIDRSMGDVHGAGNPHFNLSPSKLAEAAVKVEEVLAKAIPSKKAYFKLRKKQFSEKMNTLRNEVSKKLDAVKGFKIIQFHKEFSYFFKEYNLSDHGAIEEKPGVPPSAKRIAFVASKAKADKVDVAVSSPLAPKSYLNKFTELSGVPNISVPAGVRLANSNYSNISSLQHYIANQIVKTAESKKR